MEEVEGRGEGLSRLLELDATAAASAGDDGLTQDPEMEALL